VPALRREVARRILEARKTRGDVPEGFLRCAEDLLQPKVPWEALLRAAVARELAPRRGWGARTYSVLHRRTPFLLGAILPGHRAVLPKVALVLDTSGSVTDRELSQALAEVRRILQSVGELTVYSVDAEVHGGPQRVRSHRKVALRGGGGTDMRVGIRAALEGDPDLIVVFTDGETPWPEERPRVPVVVACTTEAEAPSWAKVVRVKL